MEFLIKLLSAVLGPIVAAIFGGVNENIRDRRYDTAKIELGGSEARESGAKDALARGEIAKEIRRTPKEKAQMYDNLRRPEQRAKDTTLQTFAILFIIVLLSGCTGPLVQIEPSQVTPGCEIMEPNYLTEDSIHALALGQSGLSNEIVSSQQWQDLRKAFNDAPDLVYLEKSHEGIQQDVKAIGDNNLVYERFCTKQVPTVNDPSTPK